MINSTKAMKFIQKGRYMFEQETRTEKVEKITKVNQSDQARHINYFSRCPLGIRLEIFEQHRDFFPRLREKYKLEACFSDISYCALILAIAYMRAKEKSLVTKNFKDFSLDEIRDLSSFVVNKFVENTTKRSEKREKLIGYWSLVRNLKIEHGLSFMKISQYLLKKRKFKVSVASIHKLWHELEVQEKNSQENTK
jgi:hypothetical protein